MPAENPIIAAINAEIARIRTLAENGWTWEEIGQAAVGFLTFVVNLLRAVNLEGVDKKALAMQAVEMLYDKVAAFVPLPMYLSPFRGWLTSLLKPVVMKLADGAIERIYQHLKLSPIPEPEI